MCSSLISHWHLIPSDHFFSLNFEKPSCTSLLLGMNFGFSFWDHVWFLLLLKFSLVFFLNHQNNDHDTYFLHLNILNVVNHFATLMSSKDDFFCESSLAYILSKLCWHSMSMEKSLKLFMNLLQIYVNNAINHFQIYWIKKVFVTFFFLF